jgi:hypothetical protein
MAHSVRISDDLYSLAQSASHALGRPLAQQIEFWARLGAALEAAGISAATAMELLGHGASADAFVAAALGHGAQSAQGQALIEEQHRRDAEDVSSGRRSARSLWAIQKGDLEGYTFTSSSTSEFERPGSGWESPP